MRLTERSIRQVTDPERPNQIHYDDDVPGFGLRVTKAGNRSFVLNYRVNGRERRLTIGKWPTWSATAARECAKDLRKQIDRGDDPLADKQHRRDGMTFGDLVEEYLRVAAKGQRARAEYERMLRRDALPGWRHIPVTDIQRRAVIALIEKKAESAPVMANRLFELLRRVFNFAIRRDIVEANPCAQVRKPGVERSKDRVLSKDELQKFWQLLNTSLFSDQTARALKLILMTAQRPGEVVAMEWDEIDLADGWWTIPSQKAKNGLAHRVPLNKHACDVLAGLPRVSSYVFPSPRRSQPMHRGALALALRRARKRAGGLSKVNDFSPHDLRRTAASHMASAGVERFVIGRVLNHVESGVTKVYDRHSYDDQKRGALDTWDRLLRAILDGETNDRIVEFPS